MLSLLRLWQQNRFAPYLLGATVYFAYLLSAWLGLALLSINQSITLFWPPIGIAVAALFRGRWWMALPILLAAFTVNLLRLPWYAALAVAIGNTVGPAVAVYGLRWLCFNPGLLSLRSFAYLIMAAVVAAAITASNGTTAIWLADDLSATKPFWDHVLLWWQGDFAGVLVFGTFFLVADPLNCGKIYRYFPRYLLLWLVVCGVTYAAFDRDFTDRGDLRLLVLGGLGLLLMLVAMASNLAFSQMVTISTTIIMIYLTSKGLGPLIGANKAVSQLSVWFWMLICTLITSIIATVQQTIERTLDQLADEKQLYETLVEGNPTLIVRFNQDGLINFANDTAEDLMGLPEKGMVGRHITEFLQREDIGRVFELLMNTGEPIPLDVSLLSHDGERHLIRWKARSIRHRTDSQLEFVAVGFDVTDVHRAESERREFLERLFHAKKLESLGVMAGGIAHDFNNLLTGILGHCELGKEYVPPGHDLLEHLNAIQASSEEAAKLVEKMLTYAGQARVNISFFDLNELIRSTIPLVHVNLPKQVEVRFNPGQKLPNIQADPLMIQQVLMNLMINAGEAIDPASGTIELQTDLVEIREDESLDESSSENRPNLPGGGYLRLRVRDDGPGMDETTRKRIFEPFFSTKFQGRGLGLASVLGIVQAHSGTIGVTSRVGHGTLFTCLLPIDYRKPENTEIFAQQPGLAARTPKAYSGLAYLTLPELLPARVQLLEQWLTASCWKVRHVKLADALTHLKPDLPDKCLYCVRWNPDDPELIRTLEALQTDQRVKILLLTEFFIQRLPEQLNQLQPRVLIEPFQQADLEFALQRLYSLGV